MADMMTRLHIDLDKIRDNTRLVAALLKPRGIRLVGVTKACPGDEQVAGAMLAGGAGALADSRLESLARLRRRYPAAELHLMRSPVTGKSTDLGAADLFFVSSEAQARLLLSMRPADAPPASICLMLETGDGREGVPPELAAEQAGRVASLEGARLAGVATNAACARPGAPLGAAMERFNEIVGGLEKIGGAGAGPGRPGTFAVISAGGSGLLPLFMPPDGAGGGAGHPPPRDSSGARITDLRCGEAILLGRIPSGSTPGLSLPGSHPDAFVLDAPVLEVFRKRGARQALVAFGVQDAGHGPVIPLQAGIRPAKITSDYLIVNCADDHTLSRELEPGARLSFLPTYYALLAAMSSPFVEKVFRGAD